MNVDSSDEEFELHFVRPPALPPDKQLLSGPSRQQSGEEQLNSVAGNIEDQTQGVSLHESGPLASASTTGNPDNQSPEGSSQESGPSNATSTVGNLENLSSGGPSQDNGQSPAIGANPEGLSQDNRQSPPTGANPEGPSQDHGQSPPTGENPEHLAIAIFDPEPQRDNRRWYTKLAEWQPDPESWWVKKIIKSNVPALKETVQPDLHILTRLYWLCVFLVCFAMVIYLVSLAYDKFFDHPILIVYKSLKYFAGLIPFPTVSFSLLASFTRTSFGKAWETLSDADSYEFNNKTLEEGDWTYVDSVKLLYTLDEMCTSKTSLSIRYNFTDEDVTTSLKDQQDAINSLNVTMLDDINDRVNKKIMAFIKEGMVHCDKLIAACTFNGKAEQCRKQFKLSYSDLGGVCSFNAMPQKAMRRYETLSTLVEDANPLTEEELKQWKAVATDPDFLRQTLGPVKVNSIVMRQDKAGQPNGLTALVAYDPNNLACPQYDGHGNRVAVHSALDEPNVRDFGISTSPEKETFISVIPEIIVADEKIRQIDKDQRGCYFPDEKQLKYYNHYSQNNCEKEYVADRILEKCKCGLVSGPKMPGTVLCNPVQISKCAKVEENNIYKNELHKIAKTCPANCNEIVYKTTVSYVPISKDNPPEILKRLSLEERSATSIVHIYWGTSNVLVKERILRYERWEKFALIGGVIGLLIGYAFIDFAYLFTVIVDIFAKINQCFTSTCTCMGGLFGWRRLSRTASDVSVASAVPAIGNPTGVQVDPRVPVNAVVTDPIRMIQVQSNVVV